MIKYLLLNIFFIKITVSFCLAAQKPNVLLMVCDDLNDYIGVLGGHPQAYTPNIDKLASDSVTFKRAYSNNPVCAPSRASFFTGIYPHTSKNLFFAKWYENPVLKNCKTMMEYFRENGYHVLGTGKNEHHFRREDWDEYKFKTDYGPYWFDGKNRTANPSVPKPFSEIGPIDGSFGPLNVDRDDYEKGRGWKGHWGKEKLMSFSTSSDDLTPDQINAKWASSKLKTIAESKNEQPFFMSVGFVRPHTPLHVQQKYFDLFDYESLKLPLRKEGDAEDTFLKTVSERFNKGFKYFANLKESYSDPEEGLKRFLHAYLASIAALDECVGEILDTLNQTHLKDNTIVLLTSDHGWDMGEKGYVFKNSLWEKSTRIPLLIKAPGVTMNGQIAEHPVSLIDIYPTLIDLCDLKGNTRKNSDGAKLDGVSLSPFLKDPSTNKWKGPKGALSMRYSTGKNSQDLLLQHWAYRTQQYRYIHYGNGKEELYDHEKDEREWTNLALNPEYDSIKEKLKKDMFSLIPKTKPSKKLSDAESAEAWKDQYFKKNPDADANGDGQLTWPEYQKHKKAHSS